MFTSQLSQTKSVGTALYDEDDRIHESLVSATPGRCPCANPPKDMICDEISLRKPVDSCASKQLTFPIPEKALIAAQHKLNVRNTQALASDPSSERCIEEETLPHRTRSSSGGHAIHGLMSRLI